MRSTGGTCCSVAFRVSSLRPLALLLLLLLQAVAFNLSQYGWFKHRSSFPPGKNAQVSKRHPTLKPPQQLASREAAGPRESRIRAAMGTTPAEGEGAEVLPRVELPEIIVSNVPGSWAYDTMLRPIEDDGGPEVAEWNKIMEPYLGMNWLDTPWLYSEFYAYRRVVEAFAFFKTGMDPFFGQKMLGVTSALASMEALAKRLLATDAEVLGSATGIKLYATTALWGNRMDLSIWPVDKGENSARTGDVFSQVLASSSQNLLADDSERLAEALVAGRERGEERIDIVVDNAGFELFCDLCLADCLATGGSARRVVIQLKGHPTFVSDAMAKDLVAMIDLLVGLDESEYHSAKALGRRWKGLLASGRWELREDCFWAQPTPLWEMPARIREELAENSSLVFLKGDANYRRLIGDRLWPTDTPFPDVAGYFPTRLCALRTLKAELGCGMPKEATERVARQDESWMVNGRYGCVQMFDPATD